MAQSLDASRMHDTGAAHKYTALHTILSIIYGTTVSDHFRWLLMDYFGLQAFKFTSRQASGVLPPVFMPPPTAHHQEHHKNQATGAATGLAACVASFLVQRHVNPFPSCRCEQVLRSRFCRVRSPMRLPAHHSSGCLVVSKGCLAAAGNRGWRLHSRFDLSCQLYAHRQRCRRCRHR